MAALIVTALVALALPPLLGPDDIQLGERNATATCSGMSLASAYRVVRPNGRVAIMGRVCESGLPHSGSLVSLRLGAKRYRTASVGQAQTDSGGEFTACPRIRVANRSHLARLTALDDSGASASTTIRVSRKAPKGCNAPQQDASGSLSSGLYHPPPPDSANPSCPLSQPGSTIGITLPSACSTVWNDFGSAPDPLPMWGNLDCANSSRHQVVGSGGDSHATATGSGQGNSSFRRLTVFDGDNVYGERCELGFNNWSGPTALYHEGQRRVTFMSLRIPNNTDMSDSDWRTVMQMKQAQGYRNPDNSPIFEMQVRDNRWWVGSSWHEVWDTPATQNTWTRFAFDITYSQDPSIGSIKIYVDLNGDGDADDANEQSPVVHGPTLRAETAGSGYSDYEVGGSIPDHLRAGIYQNPNYSCPSGCSVDVDNVQVVR